MSSAYLRLLILLSTILIPACTSSSLAFCMMYSVYKLNKHGDNIQSWRTPYPIWNQSVVPCTVNCCFLTYIQISQEADKVIWYSHLFKNFPVCCDPHSQRFGIVNKAEGNSRYCLKYTNLSWQKKVIDFVIKYIKDNYVQHTFYFIIV